MKKAKLIYNPYSGDGTFKHSLDAVIEQLQNGSDGYEVHIFRTNNYGDIEKHLKTIDKDYYDVIIACGGDGTINLVVNAMIKFGINASLGIIPSGTANDFASFLKIPKTPEVAASIIAKGKQIPMDIAKANDQYYINVLAIGTFASISQSVDKTLKHSVGKLAYYAKGVSSLPNFKPIKLRITTSTEVIEDKFYLAVFMNTSSAGGFDKLAPDADISDGKYDFIAFKGENVVEVAKPFVSVLLGEHINQNNVLYIKDNYIKVECIDAYDKCKLVEVTDVDGELGPCLPIEVNVLKNKMNIFVPSY